MSNAQIDQAVHFLHIGLNWWDIFPAPATRIAPPCSCTQYTKPDVKIAAVGIVWRALDKFRS